MATLPHAGALAGPRHSSRITFDDGHGAALPGARRVIAATRDGPSPDDPVPHLRGSVLVQPTVFTPVVLVVQSFQLTSLAPMPQMQGPGAYLLIERGDRVRRPEVAVGEGGRVGPRAVEKMKALARTWDLAVLIACQQAGFTKAHAEWLEARLTALVDAAGRATLVARQGPKRRELPPHEQQAFARFEREVRDLLLDEGIAILEEREHRVMPRAGLGAVGDDAPHRHPPNAAPAADEPGEAFQLHYRGLAGRAVWTGGGAFLVREGTEVAMATAPNLPEVFHRERARLLRTGVLAEHPSRGDRWVLARDCAFSSPTRAAGCVTGSSTTWTRVWRPVDPQLDADIPSVRTGGLGHA